PVHVGKLHSAKHDPRHPEIGFGLFGHACAMLCPLAGHQTRRWHHTEIAPDHSRGQRLCRAAPLRIAASLSIGPQTVQDETETSIIAAALRFVLPIILTQSAKFRGPTHCERIACCGCCTARLVSRFTSRWSWLRYSRRFTLIGLGERWRG